MHNFYTKSKILSGKKALQNIPFEIRQFGCSTPVIITEEVPEKANSLQILLKAFKGDVLNLPAIYPKAHFDYATVQSVEKFRDMFIKAGCDSIIALGGRTVQDIAKALKLLLEQNVEKISDLVGGIESVPTLIPLVVVPVQYSTGNEALGRAKVYDTTQNICYDLKSFTCEPEVIVFDYEMIDILPAKEVAQNIIECMATALEAYIFANDNMLVKAYVNTAMRLVGQNGRYLLLNAREKRRRAKLATARLYASIANRNAGGGRFLTLCEVLAQVLDKTSREMVALLFLPFFEKLTKNVQLADLLISIIPPEDTVLFDDDEAEVRRIIREMAGFCATEGDYYTYLMAYAQDLEFLIPLKEKLTQKGFSDGEYDFVKNILVEMAEVKPERYIKPEIRD